MQVVNQEVEFLGEVPTGPIETMKEIERAGRTAYQSWNNMTAKSYERFTEKMYTSGHWPVLDHSNIVLIFDPFSFGNLIEALIFEVRGLAYLSFKRMGTNRIFIAGSITSWLYVLINLEKHVNDSPIAQTLHNRISNTLHDHIPFIFKKIENTEKFEIIKDCNEIPKELKKFSFRVVTNRGISHEIVRHRPCAFLQESSRWIKYDDLVFVPSYEKDTDFKKDWNWLMSHLPNDTKTEIIITADLKEFQHIIKLRTHKAAHFQFQYIAKEFEKHLSEYF